MNRAGQILLELLVAIGVIVMTLVVIARLSTKALSNSGFSNHQSVATGYSIAGMEWLRSQKDLDWVNINKSGTFCLNSLAWNSSCTPIAGIYTRKVDLTIILPGNNQVQAVVTVTWSEGTKSYSARQTAVFSRY